MCAFGILCYCFCHCCCASDDDDDDEDGGVPTAKGTSSKGGGAKWSRLENDSEDGLTTDERNMLQRIQAESERSDDLAGGGVELQGLGPDGSPAPPSYSAFIRSSPPVTRPAAPAALTGDDDGDLRPASAAAPIASKASKGLVPNLRI